MIVIIDYNMGNVSSIENILKKVGIKALITSEPSALQEADKIILPGVGSFDYGIQSLNSLGLTETLKEKVLDKKTPLLGICLGMQILTEGSEEGVHPGLGFFKAYTKRFPAEYKGERLKIPHMGWNYVKPITDTPLLKNSPDDMRFYFVHSYYVQCEDPADVLAVTEYGSNFTSVIGRGNIFGVQFHPEKSHKFGINLIKNFVEL
ncbi:MAG: imidazole glycerol phosphate synthase subunit HisH [Syntrophomonas sp.]